MVRTATSKETVARKPRKSTARRKGNGHTRGAARKAASGPPDQFGFRSGSLKSRAAAMYASKKGATLAEVKDALKSSQFNLLTELEKRKVKIERTQDEGSGARKVTRYHIVI